MSALTRARQVRAGPRLCFCGDVGQRVSPWMESSPHAWVKVEMAGFSWGRRRANIFNVPPDASRNRPAHTGPQGDGTGPCVRGCGVPRAQGAGGPPRAIRPARRRDPSVIRLVSGRETYTDRSYYTRALAALVPGERRSVGTVTDRAVEGTGVGSTWVQSGRICLATTRTWGVPRVPHNYSAACGFAAYRDHRIDLFGSLVARASRRGRCDATPTTETDVPRDEAGRAATEGLPIGSGSCRNGYDRGVTQAKTLRRKSTEYSSEYYFDPFDGGPGGSGGGGGGSGRGSAGSPRCSATVVVLPAFSPSRLRAIRSAAFSASSARISSGEVALAPAPPPPSPPAMRPNTSLDGCAPPECSRYASRSIA